MRDEMDARLWAANHGHFSASIAAGLDNFASRLRRIELRRAPAAHVAIALLASGLTLVTAAFANA